MASMEKGFKVGVTVLRFLMGLIRGAESMKDMTGEQKKDFVMRKTKLVFTLGDGLNAIGESDVAKSLDALDNVIGPAIDEIVAINNEFKLWDMIVGFWDWLGSLGGEAPAMPAPEAGAVDSIP